MLAEGLIEENVVACGGTEHHAHTHAVGTVFVNQLDGVGRVAQTLRHLASQLVAHDTGEVDVLEGHLAGILVAGHDHAGHPEEDDVGAGHQVGSGVVVGQLLAVGVVDAVEEADGPQPGGEPGVEGVFVLAQLLYGEMLVAGQLAGLGKGVVGVQRYHKLLFLALGGGKEISRYAVSPPQLARDAPVLYVLQPALVGVLVFGGMELYLVVHHGRQGDVGKVLHAQEPLHAQARLHGGVGIALRVAHLVLIVLYLLHQAGFLQVEAYLAAHIHAVHAHVEGRLAAHCAVGIEYVDALQVVLLAQHVVVGVVAGGHLQTARAELNLHIAVLDDGDDTVHQRYNHLLAFEPLVLGVFGVDAHGGVAHDGLGACGGHYGIAAALGVAVHHFLFRTGLTAQVVVGHIVFQIVELALLVVVYHLFVAQGCLGFGIPVHHAQTAVDEPLLIKVNKDLEHALRALLVHGEGGAVPVAAGAQSAQLLQDDAAVLMSPVPGMGEELLTGQVALLDALLGQLAHHLGFGGDGGMVGAGHPEGILALHACAPHQDVLYGVVQHVSHVEHACHIGGRNHDGVGLASVGF